MAVNVKTGKIVFMSRSYPAATSEIAIYRSELKPLLAEDDVLIGDQLFEFEDSIITKTGVEYTARNSLVDCLRNLVERRFSCLKRFKILYNKFRGNLLVHEKYVNVIVRITNMYWVGNKDN